MAIQLGKVIKQWYGMDPKHWRWRVKEDLLQISSSNKRRKTSQPWKTCKYVQVQAQGKDNYFVFNLRLLCKQRVCLQLVFNYIVHWVGTESDTFTLRTLYFFFTQIITSGIFNYRVFIYMKVEWRKKCVITRIYQNNSLSIPVEQYQHTMYYIHCSN